MRAIFKHGPLSPGDLETFFTPFLPTRLTAPARMVSIRRRGWAAYYYDKTPFVN